MPNQLTRLHIRNFRSLANVLIETGAINVLFGPNGAGKSTLLDAIWFVRDCAVRDFALASSALNHGIGLLWQGADPRANISIKLETDRAQYELLLGFSSGRIEPYAGEVLYSKEENVLLMDRKIGSDKANYYNESEESPLVNLVQPERSTSLD